MATGLMLLPLIGCTRGAPGLHSIGLISIRRNQDEHLKSDRYDIGLSGICSYTKVDGDFKLDECTSPSVPMTFIIKSLLNVNNDIIDTQLDKVVQYQKIYNAGVEAAWGLYMVFLGLNVVCFVLLWCEVSAPWLIAAHFLDFSILLAANVTLTVCSTRMISRLKEVTKGGDFTWIVKQSGAIGLVWIAFIAIFGFGGGSTF